MKKILCMLISLAMLAAIVPVSAGGVSAQDVSVTYTGATVDATNLGVGGNFYFTLAVSDNSRMYSGHWLIDYPEQFITPISCSTTWAGGICSQIQQAIEADTNTSDEPVFVYSLSYTGGSGSVPVGETGNLYTAIGMYLNSFDFGGLMVGGNMVRVRYRINALPTTNDVSHDSNGYYLEIPIVVCESCYWVPGAVLSPDVEYYREHETINVVNGKVYVNPTQASTHTVTFYGFDGQAVSTQQVENGAAATAPSVPSVINNANGTYVFYGWDVDFSSVTGDLEVHAEYVLLGDTDLNGTVTTADALLVTRYTMNLNTLTPKQLLAGDVDTIAGISTSDALRILRYTMGLITSLA